MADIDVTTLAEAIADDPSAQQQFWSHDLEIMSATEDVFSAMEGAEGSGKPFVLKQEAAKGRGQVIHFHTINPISGRAILGGNSADGKEKKARMGGYSCKVEIVRQVMGLQFAAEEFTDIGSELDETYKKLLADWKGRHKQTRMMIRLIAEATARNTIYAGGRFSLAGLTQADTFSTTLIEDSAAKAQQNGARLANLGKSKAGSDIHQFLAFSTKTALRSLDASAAYSQGLREAGLRGDENPIFAGGYSNWRGHGIFEHEPVDSAGPNVVGSPMLPKAYLGAAITAGNTAPTVKGGGNSTDADVAEVDYFECFSNAPYRFFADETPVPGNGARYIVIYNLTGGNAGKWGFYRYTVNNLGTLTTEARLRASANTDAVATLGGIAWNASIHTDAHPEGSLIFETNANAVPFGYSFLLGAMAGIRAYGSIRNKRIYSNHQNYGDDKGLGVKSIYGDKACVRSDGTAANYVLMVHAVNYLGVDLGLS